MFKTSNYTLSNDQLTVLVNSLGAELKSVTGISTGLSYLWSGDETHWNRSAPTLFPYPGRLVKGYFTHGGREYHLGIHGFARDSEFTAHNADEKTVVLALRANEATRAVYPFEFTLTVTYSLDGNRLTTAYAVENHGDEPMPYSVGGHPGFNIPFVPGTDAGDYFVAFESPESPRIYELEGGFWTGRFVDIGHSLEEMPVTEAVCDQATLLMDGITNRKVCIGCKGSSHTIHMDFSDFDSFALWPPPGTASPFLCLEPWNGLPPRIDGSDELTQRPGIRILAPGQRQQAAFTVTFT